MTSFGGHFGIKKVSYGFQGGNQATIIPKVTILLESSIKNKMKQQKFLGEPLTINDCQIALFGIS